MSERVNAADYRLPVLDVPTAIALATALMSATPEKAPENVREAAEEVRASLAALEQKLATARTQPAAPPPDARPVDALVDAAWSSLHGALTSLAALPNDLYPRAAEATELLSALFAPKRPLAFLKLRYPAEWAEVKAHIDIAEKQKLEKRLSALLGPEYMAEIRRTFELYGAALGITTPPIPEAPTDNLLDGLRDLTASLSTYVTAVLGMARKSKAGSAQVVATALEAIDRLRRTGSPAPTEDSPAPEPPADGKDDEKKPELALTPEGRSNPGKRSQG